MTLKDERVAVVSNSEAAECPVCGEPFDKNQWSICIDGSEYDTDVTHECPNDCPGAVSVTY